MKGVTWAAGTARDPHYKLTPEKPGALRPLRELVERVIAELEQLIQWQFTPPIVLHERDAKHTKTHRTVRLTRLDEAIRETFAKARTELLGVRAMLRQDTQGPRGRKATLVQPYQVSARSRSLSCRNPCADVNWRGWSASRFSPSSRSRRSARARPGSRLRAWRATSSPQSPSSTSARVA